MSGNNILVLGYNILGLSSYDWRRRSGRSMGRLCIRGSRWSMKEGLKWDVLKGIMRWKRM